MKAITTKYLGPTDTLGARIVASDGDGNRRTISYPHVLDAEGAHHYAAVGFAREMEWPFTALVSGWQRGACYVHVMSD